MTDRTKKEVEKMLDECSKEDLWQVYAWVLQRIHGKVVKLEKERAEFNAN